MNADDILQSMVKINFDEYLIIKTKYTTHYIEKLLSTCSDRGTWKWIAESNPKCFEEDNKDGEARRSHINHADLFPRLYFFASSFLAEFGEWLRFRELKIIEIEVKQI